MEFRKGDRVLMLRHADWKNDAVGTISSLRGTPRTLHDGSHDVEYWIVFDEPQRDFTDEANGMDLTYEKSIVLGRFLRPMSQS